MTQAIPSPRNTATADIRRHFPALDRQVNEYPAAYFDGPGGTQVPRQVVEAMNDYLYHHNANAHWAYPTSMETDALITDARRTLAEFLNAAPTEIAFGPNMTTLTYHLGRALGRRFEPGDEIVVTELDHHANIDPWRALAAERGIQVRMARMIPETGQLDWQDLERLLNRRTRLLAIGAASNAIGTINDIPRAARMAHSAGALLFVDAVHYAPHQLVDVRSMDCDFLGCSAYKFYGPHLGILFGREELLASLDFPKLAPAPDTVPERMETGTQNHEGIAGAAAAVDFLASLAGGATRRERLQAVFETLHSRGAERLRQMWEGLSAIPQLRLFGPGPDAPRTPTLSIAVGSLPAAQVARLLAKRGIFASHGNFYAQTLIQRLGQGQSGVLRAGCACYTTEQEVGRLIDSVQEIAAGACS